MQTELDEVLDFLTTTMGQGYINNNTGLGRKTACAKLFEILEPEQKTVAYVRENIDAIKTRFQNLNKTVRGQTIEEYGRRVLFAVNDYMSWMADRPAWEREQDRAVTIVLRPARSPSSRVLRKQNRARLWLIAVCGWSPIRCGRILTSR